MRHAIRRVGTSLALGIMAAGVVAAAVMALLPRPWRGPGTLAAVALATLGLVVFARGVRRPPR